jgi:hypothetical protein
MRMLDAGKPLKFSLMTLRLETALDRRVTSVRQISNLIHLLFTSTLLVVDLKAFACVTVAVTTTLDLSTMAKSSHIISALLLLLLSSLTAAFQVAPFSPSLAARGTASTSTTALHVFGNKKPSSASSQDALLERAKRAGVSGGFWEGEWVCKDCGYIYNRVRLLVVESSSGAT